MNRLFLITIISFLCWTLGFISGYGQHHSESDKHSESEHVKSHELSKKYKLSFALGYTHIPAAFEHGEKEASVFVPGIGLDFFYSINHKWGIGLVADLELGEYLVDFNRKDLNRERALILGILGTYELMSHWELLFGGGIEIEKHKNLGIIRLGMEYEIPIGKDWSLAPALFFDFKEAFSTWAFSMTIGKRF